MVEYLASPANRVLGARATVLGVNDSLESINTTPVAVLPDEEHIPISH